MDGTKTLRRYFQTRRFTGRRGITPMKSKHRKPIPKTRGHKVEKKYVPIRKLTDAQQHSERNSQNKDECCEDSERKRDQNSDREGEGKDKEEHSQTEQGRNTENSEKSVHPGPLQTVSGLSEQSAAHAETAETEIESEELPPWL
jgi:hypothetical protein